MLTSGLDWVVECLTRVPEGTAGNLARGLPRLEPESVGVVRPEPAVAPVDEGDDEVADLLLLLMVAQVQKF